MHKELKPCQAVARGTIRWRNDWERKYYVCRADCKKCDRHAEASVPEACLDQLVALITERDVMMGLPVEITHWMDITTLPVIEEE